MVWEHILFLWKYPTMPFLEVFAAWYIRHSRFKSVLAQTVYEFVGVRSRKFMSCLNKPFLSALTIVRHLRRQKAARASKMPRSNFFQMSSQLPANTRTICMGPEAPAANFSLRCRKLSKIELVKVLDWKRILYCSLTHLEKNTFDSESKSILIP